jgi:hypothetical protein
LGRTLEIFPEPELGILREFDMPRQGRVMGFIFNSGN